MKVVYIHLEGPHTVKKIMEDEKVNALQAEVAKGLKAKDRDREFITAYDISNNPIYFRLGSLLALDIGEFDIKDL